MIAAYLTSVIFIKDGQIDSAAVIFRAPEQEDLDNLIQILLDMLKINRNQIIQQYAEQINDDTLTAMAQIAKAKGLI